MTKEVTKKEGTEMVEQGMFEGFSSGFENTDSQTFKTPFLKILQAMSPELDKNKPKYIQGASQGQFCNSATQQVYDDINIAVLKVDHSLVVWQPDRGGFVGHHKKTEEEKVVSNQEGVKKWDVAGNEVIDTIEFYCVNMDDPSDIFIFPLSTASLKHAKAFATRLRMLKMDGKAVGVSWAGIWNISTVSESNDKGSWYTLGATPKFERLITKDERDNVILPALELLKTAETDYSAIDATEGENEEVEY